MIDSYIDAQKGEVVIEVDSRTHDYSNPSSLYSKRKDAPRSTAESSKVKQLEKEVERLTDLLEDRTSQVNKLASQ